LITARQGKNKMEVKSIICARCGDEVEDNGTKLCYQCLEKEEESIDYIREQQKMANE
jgi:NMD protein affecting ribosome stability and mRNA decay